jgi:hypothetical protein
MSLVVSGEVSFLKLNPVVTLSEPCNAVLSVQQCQSPTHFGVSLRRPRWASTRYDLYL